jgi:hypothetical protein
VAARHNARAEQWEQLGLFNLAGPHRIIAKDFEGLIHAEKQCRCGDPVTCWQPAPRKKPDSL